MSIAFVLINTDVGGETQVIDALKSVEHVKEVYQVYGAYDVIVKLEADTTEKLKEIIESKVRRLERVKSTLTMVTVEG